MPSTLPVAAAAIARYHKDAILTCLSITALPGPRWTTGRTR